jgi:hypothetical protein
LVELLLDAFVVGDIDDESFEGFELTVIPDAAAPLHNPAGPSAAVDESVFDIEGTFFFEGLLDLVPDALAVVGMDEVVEEDGAADEFVGGIAGQFEAAGADKLHGPGRFVGTAVSQSEEIADEAFGLPAGGDVAIDAPDAFEAAVAVEKRSPVGFDNHQPAVFGNFLAFKFSERLFLPDSVLDDTADFSGFLRQHELKGFVS